MIHHDERSRGAFAAAAGLFIPLGAGLAVLLYCVWNTIGVGADTVEFLKAAENLRAGRGLVVNTYHGGFEPLSHYPPLLSLMLAGLNALGMTLESAGRALMAFFFAANVFLVAAIISRHTRTRWMPLVGALLFALSTDTLIYHSMLETEPPFFTFLLLALMWMGRFTVSRRLTTLMWAGAATALALLTRYPGIVLVPLGVWVALSRGRLPLKRRIWRATAFTCIAMAPVCAFLLRNELAGHSATDRKIAFHLPEKAQHWEPLARTMERWFFQDFEARDRHPAAAAAGEAGTGDAAKYEPHDPLSQFMRPRFGVPAVILLAGLFWLGARRHFKVTLEPPGGESFEANEVRQRSRALLRIFVVFCPLYFAFLLVSITFLDVATPLDARILFPLYLCAIIALSIFLDRVFAGGMKSPYAMVCAAAAALMIVGYGAGTMQWLSRNRDFAKEYTNSDWKNSPLMAHIRNDIPETTILFSNVPDAISYMTGRWAQEPPARYDFCSNIANPKYAQELEGPGFKGKMRDGALFVFFDAIQYRTDLLRTKELEAIPWLKPVWNEAGVGTVYAYREP